MTRRKQLTALGYIFFVLIVALVVRTLVAQNGGLHVIPMCSILAGHGSIGRPALSMPQKQPHVHIIEATYGDKSTGNICIPNLSICKDTSSCEFKVDDSLCDVDAKVKVLEVVWDCGAGTELKTSTAAKGTNISLICGN